VNVKVVLSDMQIPDHDVRAVAVVQQFAADVADELWCVGDEADSPEVSKWNKASAGEYVGTLQKGLDTTHRVLKGFRDAIGPDKLFRIQRSNHTDRIRTYTNRYAPALASLRDLRYEKLIRLEELGIEFDDQPADIAPGWVIAHGDEGSLIRTAGGTAMNLARRFGKSVVCGHTHKLGLQHDHDSVNGRIVRQLFGFEVGHLMNLKRAHYLRAGSANWQQGIGVLVQDGRDVHPVAIPIVNGRIHFDGRIYRG
jgi:hypothetical protein